MSGAVRRRCEARVYSHNGPIGRRKRGCILTTDQSDAGSAGSAGIFSRRTNQEPVFHECQTGARARAVHTHTPEKWSLRPWFCIASRIQPLTPRILASCGTARDEQRTSSGGGVGSESRDRVGIRRHNGGNKVYVYRQSVAPEGVLLRVLFSQLEC
eukprot:285941-Prorocentrum_minimum.AAC.1